ncbi:MAG: hypothetical protein Q9216_003604 [Gyalolechia sp. 2 TL-2023]
MGIPRLAGHLQPFAVSATLGSDPNSIAASDTPETRHFSSNVVIDGPGLAYHVYYKSLAGQSSTLNAYDARPSYRDIGEAFLVYLQEMEAHGLVITHIFFDGALPLHKRPVRISRLESSLKDLTKLHGQYPKGFPTTSLLPHSSQQQHSSGNNPRSLFTPTTNPLTPFHRLLPAPPFLVPAVLDALATSKYASVASIVPGEADPYCALAARDEGGGVILTSDSDLLVYDTGIHGSSVVFFNSIELFASETKAGHPNSVLRANIFHPPSISKRLNLPGLQRLAYEIKSDPSIGLSEALSRARRDVGDPSLFRGVLAEMVRQVGLFLEDEEGKEEGMEGWDAVQELCRAFKDGILAFEQGGAIDMNAGGRPGDAHRDIDRLIAFIMDPT